MKKLSIVFTIIALLGVVTYFGLIQFISSQMHDECIKEFSSDKKIAAFVDSNAICDCAIDKTKEFGFIKFFLEDENSEARKALNQKTMNECVNPNINMEKALEEALKDVMKENK